MTEERISTKTICPFEQCDGSGYIYSEYLNREGTGYDEFITKCLCRKDKENVEQESD